MIKILLKHIIYELCIDVFFSNVYDNFIRPVKDTLFSFALPLVHRQFSTLFAEDVVSVEPMTKPQGIYYTLKYVYDRNTDRDSYSPYTSHDLPKIVPKSPPWSSS